VSDLFASADLFSTNALAALFQVIMIEQRSKAILIGVIAATVLRIMFAGVTTQLLQIVGLLLAGGILLMWVCWKMWRELRRVGHEDLPLDGATTTVVPQKSFADAAWQIVVADVSMSLDNVLAVAGAAREHPVVLVFGLLLSVALMGVAANFIARLLRRHRWIGHVGLAIIVYVALDMIYRGTLEVWPLVAVL
jgi:YjbE family integral membrane protein